MAVLTRTPHMDRSHKSYRLYDIRVYKSGLSRGDIALKPLWRRKKFWGRVNVLANQFGRLLETENFRVPGFHSVYLVPTTLGLSMQPDKFVEMDWWFREIAVPVDFAEWDRRSRHPRTLRTTCAIVDWIERGILAVARRYKQDAAPVLVVADRIRQRGSDARIPVAESSTRRGAAKAELRAPDFTGDWQLLVTVSPASGPVRQAAIDLQTPDDAFSICKRIGFDGGQVILKRTNSFRSRMIGKGYPRRFKLRKMVVVEAERI